MKSVMSSLPRPLLWRCRALAAKMISPALPTRAAVEAVVRRAAIPAVLAITTGNAGTFSVPFTLPTGTAGSTASFSNLGIKIVPDGGSTNSTVTVNFDSGLDTIGLSAGPRGARAAGFGAGVLAGASAERTTDDAGANPEPMYNQPAYSYGAVIAYNNSRVAGLGSAIFLHVSTGGATAGCVSIPTAELLPVLRWLDPSRQPRIVMGRQSDITS